MTLGLVNTWVSMAVPPKVLEAETILSLEDLPTISVVCCLYKEANVVMQLFNAFQALEYPRDKIELMWVLEKEDKDTMAAIEGSFTTLKHDELGFITEIEGLVKVIYNEKHRMKANSLNTALEEIKGEYLVVYDADVIPEEDQLLKAVSVLSEHPEITLVQARIQSYNKDENRLTKIHDWEFDRDWDYCARVANFTDGYFNLKGHSFIVRTEAVRNIGGWREIVTEDLDFGINLVINGYKMYPFNSITYEEAPPTFKQILRARTRWCKGYILSGKANAKEILTSSIGIRKKIIISDACFFKLIDSLIAPWILALIAVTLLLRVPLAVPFAIAYFVLTFPLAAWVTFRATRSLDATFTLRVWDILSSLFVYTGLISTMTSPHVFNETGHRGMQGDN